MTKRWAENAIRAADRVGAFGSHVSSLAMWVLTVVVSYDVAARFLGSPTLWASEISLHLMIALAFLGAGDTQAADAHFRVTFIRDLFPKRMRTVLDWIALLMALTFIVLFTIGAAKLTLFSFQFGFRTSTMLSLPVWPLQSLMAIGGLLLCVAIIRDAVMLGLQGSAARDRRGGTGEVI